MAGKLKSIYIDDIMQELDKLEGSKEISTEEMMKMAEQVRRERIAERKAGQPAEKEAGEIKKEELKEAIDGLPVEQWNDFEIEEELRKNKDIRRVFTTIAKKSPLMIRNIMEALDWGMAKKSHTSEMCKLLKEMGLVEERKVLKIWAKDYCIKEHGLKAELTEEEKDILDKFAFWTKSMKEEKRAYYLGVSGYWKLAEKGKVRVLQMARSST